MHQPSAGIGGTASGHQDPGRADALHQAEDGRAHRPHTGQTVEQIDADSDRDRWFTAEEAKDYGFIDEVIRSAAAGPDGRARLLTADAGQQRNCTVSVTQRSRWPAGHPPRRRSPPPAQPAAGPLRPAVASWSAPPRGQGVRTRTTSSSRSGSSSSACRSTTPRPTTSWRSCSTLESIDPDRDITMYINSPGGSFTALTAIYDTMQFVKPDIQTVCMGQAASAAAVLLAAGTPGKRLALPNARILIHQPSTEGGYGQVSDLEIQANEILRMRDAAGGDPRQAHHQRRGAGPPRHRAGQDPHGRGGQGVRPGRRGPRRAASAGPR